jgi:CheY-like chemotaxis protein
MKMKTINKRRGMSPCIKDSSEAPVPARLGRILVADDDEAVRGLISTVLADAGFNVNAASDGQEAWEALLHKRYDLLVTDNEMPRLGGMELIKRIHNAGMSLPIIIASGTFPAERVRDDPQLQIAAVLPKPFRIPELLDTVRDVLASSRGDTTKHQAAGREWRCAFQHDAASPNASLPLIAGQPKAPNALPKRVLIAEDDSVVRGSLAAVLESEGYVVDEARNGIEAVTHAIEHLPDLVLLDLNMPHWDGWTAFSQLDRVTPLLPIVVITARPNQYEKAVRLGVDAFMEKPLNIPVLVRAIKRLTGEDEKRHVRRITNPAFVTRLLDSVNS